MTEEKPRPRKDKVLRSLKVLKHFVFDFEEPVKDKGPDFQPKE